ncbi:MAG: glucokinase [Candidatus Woesearchaeota archaeon]|jgi:glucokinase|nr:glucokinase [Candidatus Woesearchaeota archaeon]
MDEFVLIGDVGGTNSNLALVQRLKKDYEIIFQKLQPNAAFDSFENLLKDFLKICNIRYKVEPEKAILSVAGEIDKYRVKLSNSKFIIDTKELEKKTTLTKIELLNDFEAIAYSVEKLEKKHVKILNKGTVQKGKTAAVIGAGTGFGKAVLIYDKLNKNYLVQASEGGHCDFVAYDKEELELVEFIREKESKEVVVLEDIISGRGIEYIYSFLQKKYTGIENKSSAAKISENKKKDPIARETMRQFFKYYSRACKNQILETLCESGLYIGGGIIANNMDFSKKEFIKELTNNHLFESLLKNTPVYIIKDYNCSLLGLMNYLNKHEEIIKL